MMRRFLAVPLIALGVVLIWETSPLPWRLAVAVLSLLALAAAVIWAVRRRRRPWYRLWTKARMFYIGAHPLLRTRRWVTAMAAPEGLVIDMGRRQGRVTLAYRQLLETTVRRDSGWRCLDFTYGDRISRRQYAMRLAVPDGNQAANELHGAIERWIHDLADATWALWRTLHLPLPVTAEERRRGGKQSFQYTRQSACLACNAIQGYNLACPQCRGKGVITEAAYAGVKIPRNSRIGQQIVIANGGNEDLNGNHGPLILRVVDAEESGQSRPASSKSPKSAPVSEPTAVRKRPVDLNDLLPNRRTGPADLNGDGPRDLNGVAKQEHLPAGRVPSSGRTREGIG